jgi:hypothetical protein
MSALVGVAPTADYMYDHPLLVPVKMLQVSWHAIMSHKFKVAQAFKN